MNAQISGDLKRLLEIKKELLAKMLDAVKRAAGFLKSDDMDAFSLEMESCSGLMTTADEMGATVERLRQQIPDPEVEKLENEITYILDQIEQARRECNDIAEQRLKTYGQQIKAIRHTRRGVDGYASQFQRRDALFIDAKK